jgi:hypothetical protein
METLGPAARMLQIIAIVVFSLVIVVLASIRKPHKMRRYLETLLRLLRQHHHWFIYAALALPGILLPQFDYISVNRVRYSVGWPITGMDVVVGDVFGDGHVVHFQPDLGVLAAIALWVFIVAIALRTRRWATGCQHWRAAPIQALVTSLYSALVIWFLFGATQVIWDAYQWRMNWAELERSDRFARHWLPFLHGLGAASVLTLLFVDSLGRRFNQRVFHLVCAVMVCFGFWRFLPYFEAQLKQLDSTIHYAHEEQIKHK